MAHFVVHDCLDDRHVHLGGRGYPSHLRGDLRPMPETGPVPLGPAPRSQTLSFIVGVASVAIDDSACVLLPSEADLLAFLDPIGEGAVHPEPFLIAAKNA